MPNFSIVVAAPFVVAIIIVVIFVGVHYILDNRAIYIGAFVGIAPIIPMIAAVITVVAYLLWVDLFPGQDGSASRLALLFGSLLALIGWLLFAIPYRRFAMPTRANPHAYNELLSQMIQLDARLQVLCPNGLPARAHSEQPSQDVTSVHVAEPTAAPSSAAQPEAATGTNGGARSTSSGGHLAAQPPAVVAQSGAVSTEDISEYECAACREACINRDWIAAQLGYRPGHNEIDQAQVRSRAGLRWITGTGYIQMWNMLHHAEEALFYIESTEEVIAEALYSELRLQDSKIINQDKLLAKLRRAVTVMNGNTRSYYLNEQPPNDTDANNSGNAGQQHSVGIDPQQERKARAVLNQVSRTINEFRDSRREGLVRARNQLRATVMITWLATYLIVVLLVTMNVPKDAQMAGSVFFMVAHRWGCSTACVLHRAWTRLWKRTTVSLTRGCCKAHSSQDWPPWVEWSSSPCCPSRRPFRR
jgi:hypothetical protein